MKPLVKICGIKELNILNELVNLDKMISWGLFFTRIALVLFQMI